MYGSVNEAQDSLSNTNVRASRLSMAFCAATVGCVRGGGDGWVRWVGTGHPVVEQPDTHSYMAL